jgi:nucleoporin POM152
LNSRKSPFNYCPSSYCFTKQYHSYTRSENAKRGKKAAILETRNDKSYEFSKSIRASDEGTYEAVAIKDKYCAFSLQKGVGRDGKQKLLQL